MLVYEPVFPRIMRGDALTPPPSLSLSDATSPSSSSSSSSVADAASSSSSSASTLLYAPLVDEFALLRTQLTTTTTSTALTSIPSTQPAIALVTRGNGVVGGVAVTKGSVLLLPVDVDVDIVTDAATLLNDSGSGDDGVALELFTCYAPDKTSSSS
jgi:hypothetical protein